MQENQSISRYGEPIGYLEMFVTMVARTAAPGPYDQRISIFP